MISSSTTTGSSTTSGSTSPSTATPSSWQLAQAEAFGHRTGSDINTSANPLVETDHGPGIGVLPSQLTQTDGFGQWGGNDVNWNANPLLETDHGPGIGASTSQLAKSLSQLVQALAAFGADHQDLPELAETQHPDGQTNPGQLAVNFFKQQG